MEELSNLPTPDPAWDYYIPWARLQRAKALIDQALEYFKDEGYSNKDSDEAIRTWARKANDELDVLDQEMQEKEMQKDSKTC